TQRVHGRIQHFLAITNETTQFATGNLRGDALARAAADELHLVAVRVALPRHHFQPCHAATNHQRLAAADEDIEAAVILRNHGHADVCGKIAHRLVASIEQVV